MPSPRPDHRPGAADNAGTHDCYLQCVHCNAPGAVGQVIG
ncbi:hypothetical protein BSU04_20965 [Caballeronia sordidicola]|uniref:Uncharacterized protein n=1 Tax=Caballeronia sordidicola TaxID=196367 RepID=A0A226X0T3_CABSO|nr:hypothetical protein BSU04_20965 [Caballeronia sordidicola]